MRTNTEYTEAVEMENRREGPDKDTQKNEWATLKKGQGETQNFTQEKNC